MPAELAEILGEIIPPASETSAELDGAFRHRQHIQSAFIAVRRYGTAQAAEKIGAWLRHLSARALEVPCDHHPRVDRAGRPPRDDRPVRDRLRGVRREEPRAA